MIVPINSYNNKSSLQFFQPCVSSQSIRGDIPESAMHNCPATIMRSFIGQSRGTKLLRLSVTNFTTRNTTIIKFALMNRK